jgi:hypothetical protein
VRDTVGEWAMAATVSGCVGFLWEVLLGPVFEMVVVP